MQNVGLEVSRLRPGQVVGLLKLFDRHAGIVYGFQHLAVKEVTSGRAKFDVISFADGGARAVAEGQLIENPPTIVIDVPNLSAASLVPQPVDEELMFADEIFRLPAGAGQNFSITANFTSVSAREDVYLPQERAVTASFTTTGLASGAPRIDRLLPVHGEVYRNVHLRGTGFGTSPSENLVTFASTGGARVPAEVIAQTNDELVVSVPPEAVSGPVELTVGGKVSNDFSFFVRFHPETVLLFDSFTNNMPTPLRLLHQQPLDEAETAGEVPLGSVVCTLGAGHIVVTDLSTNQQVGTVINTSFYDNRQTTNLMVYAGQEANPPQRYLFAEVPYEGSDIILARLYYSEHTNGVTLQLESVTGLFALSAGGLYDFQFIVPIYRPPAAAGTEVPVRLETISQPWTSIPGSEMRLIWNSTQRVQ